MSPRITTTAEAVSAVLDADRLSELLGHEVRACRIRIKPGVSLLFSLQERVTGRSAGWARLLWPVSHSKARKAERLVESVSQSLPMSLPMAPSAERPLITRSLEGDLLLQSGPVWADPKLVEPMAQAARLGVLDAWGPRDVLRYNPSRRLVLRTGSTVLRLRAQATGRTDDVHRALARFLPVPHMIDSDAVARCRGHVSVQQWCGEGNLAEAGAAGADRAGEQTVVEATRGVGVLLARLHSSTALLPDDVARHLPRQCPDPRALAEVHARQLDALDPNLAERVRAVGETLPAQVPGALVLTHGDASPDQVLWEGSTGRIWLTDFDRVRLAPGATDLGSYLAVAPPSEGRALLDGYAEHLPAPAAEHLGTAIALSRLTRLNDPLRQADPAWHERIDEELTALDGGASSVPVP